MKKCTWGRYNFEGQKDPPVSSYMKSSQHQAKSHIHHLPCIIQRHIAEQKGRIIKVFIIQFSTGLELTTCSPGFVIMGMEQDCMSSCDRLCWIAVTSWD